MAAKQTKNYLEVQVQTASKEQLLLMLYDGALRFCDLARQKLAEEEHEASHTYLLKAKAIVVELMCSLDRKIGETLYSNLTSLYNFIYMRMVQANFNKDVTALEEAVQILNSLRETWCEAIQKNTQEGGTPTYAKPAQSSTFSIQG